MRATERRKRLRAVLAKHVPRISKDAHLMLNKRFVLVKNDIKVLKKGLDWEVWIDDFAKGLQGSLEPVVEDLADVENQFWLAKGVKLSPVQVQDIWDAYEARVGRQITGIGETTRSKTLEAIASWQEDEEANYSDLVSNLEPWYGLNRANTIAKTESAFLSSQISLSVMLELGLAEWSVDLGVNACQGVCLPIAENGPYTVQDETPPFHPECDCGILYVEPLVKRNWLGKINENHDEKGRFAQGDGMGAELKAFSDKMSKSHGRTISPDEKAAILDYAEDSTEISKNLRAGVVQGETVKNLDRAIAKTTLPKTCTLYRCVNLKRLPELKVGTTYSDASFTSTTLDKVVAKDYAGGQDREPGLLVINAPAGTHAVAAGAHPELRSDHEVILARNSKFRVTKVTHDGDMPVYHLRIIK